MPPARLPLGVRLERQTIPEPNSGCWLWFGSLDGQGHGKIRSAADVIIGTHRAAWEVANGPIPSGLCVCHRCDVRCCVNPDHLFLGTAKDNRDDMYRKARHAFGARSGAAKLSDGAVRALRSALGAGSEGRIAALATHYGISVSRARAVAHGSGWRHIAKQIGSGR